MRSRQSVSIVIPAYNEECHLTACLDAIARQTSPVLEAIVVDNNSVDKTVAIARSYPFVRVVKEPTQGRVFARNTGFNAARGDIIGRIDADITLPDNWVQHVQAFYAVPDNRSKAWTGRGHFNNVRFSWLVNATYAFLAFYVNAFLVGHSTMWGSNMALTKTQWRAVRARVHLRNDIHEDLDLAMHLYDEGIGIVYDRTIQTTAHMRRVRTNHDQLWAYLMWWPNTLRIHGKRTWPLCWLLGVLIPYAATYVLMAAEWAARRLGKKPLEI